MRILIIGEYSGFSKYLCRGFHRVGVEACAFNWGDTFKKIVSEPGSVTIDTSNYQLFGKDIKGSHYVRRFFSYIKMKRIIKKKKHYYDCALIVNPTFIKNNDGLWYDPLPTIEEVKSMLVEKEMIFLSACGNDFIFNSFLPFRKKTSEFYIKKYQGQIETTKKQFLNILDSIRGVIPVMVDYADAYRYFQTEYNYKIFNTIPLPYDVKLKVETKERCGKINIFHGVTRSKEKGSEIIIKALKIIAERYNDKVTINIVSHLPLNEYLAIMRDADIIIDQCYAHSYGMNTIEALSMGKVVLSGNEPENMQEFTINYCPVVNICPTVDSILTELDILINDPSKIDMISKESIDYALNLHDCKNIALKYINLFSKQKSLYKKNEITGFYSK
ncbi:glycosyltransferase [Bacteroides zoogleoformans]|uniref:Glycosyltransferase involved in cell wall biosynthesis n=1 Tax=Bacteroides zoogleoformans TaxID=28119 RepID=A0ABN5II36_9BACE|nr:glycosyltransferase [Bacteroides zoogleoformans]AVM52297.1 hypothetical protein C4H11_04470 [Bacteroides zoogleoformans]